MNDLVVYQSKMLEIEEKRKKLWEIQGKNLSPKLGIVKSEVEAKNFYYYLSDLHLTERLGDLKGEKREKKIEEIVNKILKIESQIKMQKTVILVAGDIADSQEDVILFFDYLKSLNFSKIVCVLGNHELWDKPNKVYKEKIADYAVSIGVGKINKEENSKIPLDILKIKIGLKMKKITLLDGGLLILGNVHNHNHALNYENSEEIYLTQSQLKELSVEEIRNIVGDNKRVIYGGIGYARYNPKLNANSGMYKNSLSREDEIKEGKKFEYIYEKLRKAIPDTPLIVLTHNPVMDWSNKPIQKGWRYVNGHTHVNKFKNQNGGYIFSNNQYTEKGELNPCKYFEDSEMRNPFEGYPDGIHSISLELYELYYKYICNIITTTLKKGLKGGRLLLLKRQGYYMYILEKENKDLFVLEGGRLIKLKIRNVEFYYNNMLNIVNTYNSANFAYLRLVEENLRYIADVVAKIGGNGSIHGLIVDISGFYHIYYDGSTIEYYQDFSRGGEYRIEYENMESLVKELNLVNYEATEGYKKLVSNGLGITDELLLTKPANKEGLLNFMGAKYTKEDIQNHYKLSEYVNKLEYLKYFKLIRFWPNEKLFSQLYLN